ncbi:MAG: LysR family transcriptional regulator [Firmicutes bacterium]|nr:LysR family transcriptional regulator [Bacillota bacterium]
MKRYHTFLKVIELGSFTKTAEELGYTQSAISQMIQSLETELDTKLLLRSRSGIELTADGRELLPYIQTICNSYHSLSEKLKEMHNLQSGVIRIGTFSSISCYWLPPLIEEFHRIYPDISFQLHQAMEYSTMHDWIQNGQVDFGFLPPIVKGEMQCIALQEDHLMAILSPSHPLASRPVLTLAELAKEPYILLEEGDINESLRTFRQNQLEPNIQYRVHDDYTIMSMVERNLGVSIISSIFLENPSYRLAIRPIDPPVTRTLGVAFRHLETMPTATRHFVDLIVQKYGSIEKGRAQWNELFR